MEHGITLGLTVEKWHVIYQIICIDSENVLELSHHIIMFKDFEEKNKIEWFGNNIHILSHVAMGYFLFYAWKVGLDNFGSNLFVLGLEVQITYCYGNQISKRLSKLGLELEVLLCLNTSELQAPWLLTSIFKSFFKHQHCCWNFV